MFQTIYDSVREDFAAQLIDSMTMRFLAGRRDNHYLANQEIVIPEISEKPTGQEVMPYVADWLVKKAEKNLLMAGELPLKDGKELTLTAFILPER
jgi:hypothetical protein